MKGHLQSYTEHFRTRKLIGYEPTKPTEPSFDGFVGNKTEGLQGFETKNRSQQIGQTVVTDSAETSPNRTDKTDRTQPTTPPEVCPHCTANLKSDDTTEILVRFCPFDCSFIYYAFNNWKAARVLFSQMIEIADFDEFKTITNALDKRTTFYLNECSFDYETAMRRAEADLIPAWLNEYQLNQKFK